MNTSRSSIIVCFSLGLLVWITGCATATQPFGPVIPEEIRTKIHTIAVSPATEVPEAKFQMPAKGWSGGLGRGAAAGAGGMLEAGTGSGNALGFALALALPPPATLIGGIYGAIAANPTKMVEEADAVLKKALVDLKMQESLRDRVLELVRARTRYEAILLANDRPRPAERASPSGTGQEPAYDTALQTTVLLVGLAGEGSINPDLRLILQAMPGLSRTEDAFEQVILRLEYRGGPHRFTEWAANDAQLFRDEVARAYQELAEQIVEELFLVYQFAEPPL